MSAPTLDGPRVILTAVAGVKGPDYAPIASTRFWRYRIVCFFSFMAKIIVNGCSHTLGWGLPHQHLAWPSLVFSSHINLSKCGDSNPGIARRTLEYIVSHKDITHVFVMWTNNDRFEMSTADHRYLMILGNGSWGADLGLKGISDRLHDHVENHYRYFSNDKHRAKNFLLNLHHLKLLCDSRGIAFLCAASMPIDLPHSSQELEQQWQALQSRTISGEQLSTQNYTSEVDSFRYLQDQTQSVWIDRSYQYGLVTNLASQYLISDSDPHANIHGHKFIADKLISVLPEHWLHR